MVDASTDRGWTAAGTDLQWIQIDFKQAEAVDLIILKQSPRNPLTSYTVSVSRDGAAWETLRRAENASISYDDISFTSRLVKSVRVEIEKIGGEPGIGFYHTTVPVQLGEIEIYRRNLNLCQY